MNRIIFPILLLVLLVFCASNAFAIAEQVPQPTVGMWPVPAVYDRNIPDRDCFITTIEETADGSDFYHFYYVGPANPPIDAKNLGRVAEEIVIDKPNMKIWSFDSILRESPADDIGVANDGSGAIIMQDYLWLPGSFELPDVDGYKKLNRLSPNITPAPINHVMSPSTSWDRSKIVFDNYVKHVETSPGVWEGGPTINLWENSQFEVIDEGENPTLSGDGHHLIYCVLAPEDNLLYKIFLRDLDSGQEILLTDKAESSLTQTNFDASLVAYQIKGGWTVFHRDNTDPINLPEKYIQKDYKPYSSYSPAGHDLSLGSGYCWSSFSPSLLKWNKDIFIINGISPQGEFVNDEFDIFFEDFDNYADHRNMVITVWQSPFELYLIGYNHDGIEQVYHLEFNPKAGLSGHSGFQIIESVNSR